METTRQTWGKIGTFLALTAGMASVFYYLIITRGGIDAADGRYTFGLMWTPGVAAIITRLIFQHNLRGFGWVPRNWRLHAVAYLLPLLYGVIVYGLVWSLGLGQLNQEALQSWAAELGSTGAPAVNIFLIGLTYTGTVGLVIYSLPSALGEELGWRGLLVPELAKRLSFTKTALISGVFWLLYHAPLIIWSDYSSGAPLGYVLAIFTVGVISTSFIAAWLRLRTGSVWPAVLLHASHNLFIGGFFDELTIDTGVTRYLTTEFGAGIMLAVLLVAFICWRWRDAVERPPVVAPALPLASAPAAD